MKFRNLFLFLLFWIVLLAEGQSQKHFNIHRPIELPDKSQEALIKQRIGYTDISIRYHSPGVKGRKIWGGLVPHGQVWRAGANENTIFTITHDATVNGRPLKAGSYGLHLLPEKEEWTFIFSNNHTSWGSYFYEPKEDALRITVAVEEAVEFREWMSYDFVKRDRGEATVTLRWAGRQASFSIALDIDAIALNQIRLQLRSDAYWEWFSWCQAAAYCAEYEINTEEALEWIDHSISMQENFSNWDVKADLLSQNGDEAGARKAMERALEVGTPIYIERYGRRMLGQKKPERAVEVFDLAIKKDSNYWRAHFNKGVALEALNKNQEALISYKKALQNAPEGRQESIQSKINSIEKK